MAVELATAYVSVVPSFQGGAAALTRGLDAPLDNEGRKAGRRFGSGFAGSLAPALKVAAGGLAATFAVDFAGDAISSASDLSEAVSKNTVVFGEASESVLAFAKGSATAFGQSRNQALAATGTFGNLFRSIGLGEKQSADLSVSLTGLASDMASFNNVPVDDALTALRSGLVGETEPLKRFGVNLNEATLKQKALELGLSDGKETLDANAKAQAAYALIMEQTSLAQGDFARTSDGLANQQRIMSAQFENAKAALGQALLPAMTAVISFVNDTVIPGFKNLVAVFNEEGLDGLLRRVGEGFQAALPVIGAALGDFGRTLIDWVVANAPVFAQQLLDLGEQLVAWVGPQIPPLLAELGRLMGEVGGWILRDGVPLLVESSAELAVALIGWVATEAIPGLLRELPGVVETVGDWIIDEGVPAFIEFGKDLGSALIEGLVDSFKDLPSAPEAILDLLGGDKPDWLREVEGRAGGGRVMGGEPYIVGERHAELFVPDVDGTILPDVPSGFGASGPLVGSLTVVQMPGEDSVTSAARELRRIQLLVA